MDDSKAMGRNAEDKFVDLFKSHNHTVARSTKDQDMREHWDFKVDDKYRVEVKSRKKSRRGDSQPNDEWVYVEFKNVRGDAGWLYGTADYIAFERPTGFRLVSRVALIELAETLIKTEWVDRPTPYKSYRRVDRPAEHVGVLMYSDLLTIPNKMIHYK